MLVQPLTFATDRRATWWISECTEIMKLQGIMQPSYGKRSIFHPFKEGCWFLFREEKPASLGSEAQRDYSSGAADKEILEKI